MLLVNNFGVHYGWTQINLIWIIVATFIAVHISNGFHIRVGNIKIVNITVVLNMLRFYSLWNGNYTSRHQRKRICEGVAL